MKPDLSLKYPRIWMCVGIGGLGLLFYLSFADLSVPQVLEAFGDKVNHLLAYGCLMGWFGQIFQTMKERLAVAFALICLGFIIELVKGQLAHRWFDLQDAAANTLGVALALVLLSMGAGKILFQFERKIITDSRN